MVYIVLYLVGGLLFVNGLFLAGHVTNLAGVASFNFIGGTLITVMALYIAALVAHGETVIKDFGCVNISFPGFIKEIGSVTEG